MNKCRKCNENFNPTKHQIKKSDFICKACLREQTKQWRRKRKESGKPIISTKMSKEWRRKYEKQYLSNPEKRKRKNENAKKYRLKNIEYYRNYNKKYYEKNKEDLSEKARLNYLKNSENLKNKSSEWRKNNPEKNRLQESKRRARKAKCKGNFNKTDWDKILNKSKGKCFYCKKKTEKLTIDHVIPISKGGDHCISNIVAACLSCNCSKGSKIKQLL